MKSSNKSVVCGSLSSRPAGAARRAGVLVLLFLPLVVGCAAAEHDVSLAITDLAPADQCIVHAISNSAKKGQSVPTDIFDAALACGKISAADLKTYVSGLQASADAGAVSAGASTDASASKSVPSDASVAAP